MPTIIVWDLDGTILDTDRLFAPVNERVAAVAGISLEQALASRRRVAKTAFTLPAWLHDVGLSGQIVEQLVADINSDLARRAPDCLYEGVRALLEELPVRHVLATAGDPEFQAQKFGLLGLGHCFKAEDRHFVPRQGSKADVINNYTGSGPVAFVENLSEWHWEVVREGLLVTQIRILWPGSATSAPSGGDGVRWQIATTISHLRQLLTSS